MTGSVGEGLLVTLGIHKMEGESVGDPTGGFEGRDYVDDEIFGDFFVGVSENEVDVAAECLASTVTAGDYALDVPSWGWAGEVGVVGYDVCDLLDFGAGNSG